VQVLFIQQVLYDILYFFKYHCIIYTIKKSEHFYLVEKQGNIDSCYIMLTCKGNNHEMKDFVFRLPVSVM